MADDSLGVLLGVVTDDEEVRAAIKHLALSSIAEAQDLLTTGIPSIRMQVIRSVLPALTKALQHSDTRDMDELKRQVGEMYAAIGEQIA